MSEKSGIVIFPIINGLTPTAESCTMKVLEEVGELMQLIGKHSGLNGEEQTISDEVRIRRTIFEALDVAQSAITMAHTLCELYKLPLESFVQRHEEKLIKKGYLKDYDPEDKESQIEVECRNCRYFSITREILTKLVKDPCETCDTSHRNWKPKEVIPDGQT
jgi:NTP pyrophosphatase (non-canonical NTP hydrolase)